MRWRALRATTHLRGPKEHLLADVVHAGGDDAQRHAGEDVGVVALARVQGLAVDGDRRERRARGEHGPALSDASGEGGKGQTAK